MALARSLAGSLARPLASAITGAAGGGADTYAANGFSPDYVADFSAASADYFRVAGNDSDFATAFTSDSEGGGLAVQNDSSGKLVWRAHNLWPGSENIINSQDGWAADSTSVQTANAAVSPDGSTTAERLAGNGTETNGPRIYKINADTGITTGGTYTIGIFAKKETVDFFFIDVQLFTGGTSGVAYFDLENGTLGTQGLLNETITSVGNGWYLCTADITVLSSDVLGFIGFSYCEADGSKAVPAGNTCLVWGAHCYRSDLGGMADNPDAAAGLEKYVPTTTAARYLARRRHHRWDGSAWVPTCLHEPVGATNLLQYSNDFSQWTIGGTDSLTVTSSSGMGPDGNTSLSLLEITDTTNEVHGLFRSEPISAGTRYVASGYLRNDDQRYVALRFYISNGNYAVVVFDLNDGSVTQETDVGTVTLHDSGVISEEGGLYRVWLSATESTATTAFVAIDFASTGTPSFNSAGAESYAGAAGVGLYAGFCDLVAGSLPSSPIITNGSTVTRTADTLKGKAASLPYSSTAMSVAMKGRLGFDGSNNAFWGWGSNAGNRLTNYPAGDDLISGWSEASTNRNETLSSVFVGAGESEPFNIACRVSGTFNQVAEAGVASSGLTFSDSLPDLSANDFYVFDLQYIGGFEANGTVDTIRLWDEDIAEAGIEQASAPSAPYAFGGTITEVGGYRYHTFTSGGTLEVVAPGDVEYLVVAGGGGGGRSGNSGAGGGGGAGGMLTGTTALTAASYTVTVGAGGAGGTSQNAGDNGTDSVLTGIATATGGGGGGGNTSNTPSSGGSGGGGGATTSAAATGAAGTAGQGSDGGDAVLRRGGGGGGKAAAGADAVTGASGDGGAGAEWPAGSGNFYAGGGGGGDGANATPGAGGVGGGGNGGAETAPSAAVSGTANTGGGGGGDGGNAGGTGGDGGSGIVIVRYAI